MSTLQQRTQVEFYTDLINRLKGLGAAQGIINQCVREAIGQAKSLLAGRCPKCGEPIARYVDYERQQGEKGGMPGAWVQYRCSTQPPPGTIRPPGVCDFMQDYVEGEAAS